MPLKGLDAGIYDLVVRGRRLRAEVGEAITEASLSRTIDGASTLRLALHDPNRELVRSDLFGGRVAFNLDDLLFELAQVQKQGSMLSLTAESAYVADLRRRRGVKVARKKTTTRTRFVRQLTREVKGLKFRGEPSTTNLVAIGRGTDGNKRESSWDCSGRLAADRRWRRFEDEGVLFFGSDDWLAGLAQPYVVREDDEGIDDISFDIDAGKRAQTCSIACHLRLWAARPGAPVRIRGLGSLVGDRLWLVQSIDRGLFTTRGSVNLVRRTEDLPEPKPDVPKRHDDPGSHAGGESGGSPGRTSSQGFMWPVRGTITGRFGDARPGHTHAGLDIAAPTGTPVVASKDGHVTVASSLSGYGNAVYISHSGGQETRYAHLNSIDTRVGARVGAGQRIGTVGSTGASTGPHLHFEIRIGGHPHDPLRYLP